MVGVAAGAAAGVVQVASSSSSSGGTPGYSIIAVALGGGVATSYNPHDPRCFLFSISSASQGTPRQLLQKV